MPVRLLYAIGLILISMLIGISIYLQVYDGFIPCPLCTLQRFTFGLLGILFLLGVIVAHHHVGRLIVNTLLGLSSLIGIFLAGRQIWIQQVGGPSSGECGVSLQYMMQALPFDQVIKKVFEGSAECSQRGWEFLHFNMAEWSLIWFILFFVMSIYLFLKELHWHPHDNHHQNHH